MKEDTSFGFEGGVILLFTLLIAFWFSGWLLPDQLEPFRPLWVPMVIIYWVVALPYRIGVYLSAVVGLMLDLFLGSPMGQHMLSMAVIGYLAYLSHLRIRLFPIWQQCLTVLVIALIYQSINRIIEGMIEEVDVGFSYFLPTITTAFVWPWVYLILRYLRRRFQLY